MAGNVATFCSTHKVLIFLKEQVMDYMQRVENLKYMLGRFSMLFADMYAERPHKAQLECGRGDDGFGNVVRKDLNGYKAALAFIEA